MADNQKFVQAQSFYLAGSGAVAGATSVTLSSMTQIDGSTTLTMTDFGSLGYMTLEPNNGTQEESITFSGITQNSSGTATLTGVKTVTTVAPYTQTSGLAKSHPGGAKAIISNTSAFYDRLASLDDDETVAGVWTFPDDPSRPRVPTDTDTVTATAFVTLGQLSRQAISGASNASTTVKGIVQLPHQSDVDNRSTTGTTGALFAVTPDKQRTVLTTDYVVDTGTKSAYAINPTPAVTSYVVGMAFRFKATNANAAAPTLNVNSLGAYPLFRGKTTLRQEDIRTNWIIGCVFNGAGFDIESASSQVPVSQDGQEIFGSTSNGTTAWSIGLVPAISRYTTGMAVRFKTDVAGGHPTLNINSLGAKNVLNARGGFALTRDVPPNGIAQAVYDGTAFRLTNRSSGLLYSLGAALNLAGSSVTTEQTYFNLLIPAHTLGTNGVIKGRVYIDSLRFDAGTFTVNLYYGGTNVGAISSTKTASAQTQGVYDFSVIANAATNAQRGMVLLNTMAGDTYQADITTFTFIESQGTSAIDSTSDQFLKLTFQWSSTDANNFLTTDGYIIEAL